jgi:hypothetical protein
MYSFFKSATAAFMLLSTVVTVSSSCNKEFDQPPVYVPPTVTANATIRQLKALHTTSGNITPITQDLIIRGIVIADDRSGNYYKTIVIQDATGGIAIQLDGNNLYNNYPIGRELFINCKGLYLGDYNRLIQLGGGIDATGTSPQLADIPATLFNKYIVKGSFGNVVTPRVVDVANLTSNMNDTLQNTLIQLNNFEFVVADTNKTFALPNQSPPASVNFTIRNCSGGSIVMRNSGYANFAGINVPNGNGPVISVYTVFGSTRQLTIRDTSDVKFYGARCTSGGGGGGGGGGTVTLRNIADIRALYTGTNTSAPASTKITGIVISDRVANNVQSQNVVIQQGNGLSGIVVRFTANHTLNLGDSVDIDVSGAALSPFQGVLQLSGTSLTTADITVISTGKTITPRVATVSAIITNRNEWESTLVRIANATISSTAGANWGGTTKFTDASGAIDHFTRTGTSGATFATTPFPTGARPSITAIVSRFNTTPQVNIRNTSDVE